MSGEANIDEVLRDRSDLEDPLEEMLAVDGRHDRWTFDDVPIDSGPFGELVDRGVVERVGDEYCLADPDAVRAALSDDVAGGQDASDTSNDGTAPRSRRLPAIDRWATLPLAVAVVFVGLVRTLHVDSIYRDGAVVLSGNDPYYYRYLVEQSIANGGILEQPETGEPLLVAMLTGVTELFGGSVAAASHVLVWYPVVAAMLGAVVVYLLAVAVTENQWIGLAAVLFFALIPDHALRTSVGYADHHAFDYLWLALTAFAVTKLSTVDRSDLRRRRTVVLTGLAGLAVAGQVLAWEAGPLLVIPIAILVPIRAAIDVEREQSPLPAAVPLLAALALGTAVAVLVHLVTGFQSTVVVLSPLVFAVWSGVTLGVAVGGRRLGMGAGEIFVGFGLIGTVGLIGLFNSPPAVRSEVFGRLAALLQTGLAVETQSLLNPDSLGFLFGFGLVLVVALPTMIAGLERAVTDGRWLTLATYAWYFLLLALLQVRFVGELATFAAIFAASSFAWAVSRFGWTSTEDGIGLERLPVRLPNRRDGVKLVVLFLLVNSFGAYQVGETTSRVVVEDRVYETATFIADRADERGQEYPENYVLSDWGDNRIYNYFVSGESRSYLYAQDNYTEFAGGTDPDSWYEEFDDRVGYVVLATATDDANRATTIWRLTKRFGSAHGERPGVGHYRTVYVSADESRTAVTVVPGANLTGSASPGAEVTVGTTVHAEGVAFEYERRAMAEESGDWHVRLANPGSYNVSIGNESTNVDVPESAVESGERVRVE